MTTYKSFEEHENGSSTYLIPGAMSEEEVQDLIKVLTRLENENRGGVKNLIHSTLVVVNGGLVALSSFVLGDLISIDPTDFFTIAAVIILAFALPLLAASFWSIKIWHNTPLVSLRTEQFIDGDGQKFVRFESAVKTLFAVDGIDLKGLWVTFIAIVMTPLGIVSALWHVSWIASVTFIVSVIVGAIFVVRSALHLSDARFFAPKDAEVVRYRTYIDRWYASKETKKS